MTKNGSKGHPIRERTSFGLFLGLGDVAIDEIEQVKGYVLENALNQKHIKIRHVIVTTSVR